MNTHIAGNPPPGLIGHEKNFEVKKTCNFKSFGIFREIVHVRFVLEINIYYKTYHIK